MKIAVLSDIHGNLHALQAVLRAVESRVDRVYALGDWVGYYAFPDEVVRLAIRHRIRSTLGNHDAALLAGRPVEAPDAELAKASLAYASAHLSGESRRFLASLPRRLDETLDGRRCVLLHGSPSDELDGRLNPSDAEAALKQVAADALFAGNTHRQFQAERGGRVLVNPGSVGQPRESDKRAAYAIVEFPSLCIELVRTDYDTDAAVAACEAAGIDSRVCAALRSSP